MIIDSKEVWVIMSKDRKYIAKGTARNRHIVAVDDKKCKKRHITYSSKGMAESGFKVSGFYGQGLLGCTWKDDLSDFLEAVKVRLTLEVIE